MIQALTVPVVGLRSLAGWGVSREAEDKGLVSSPWSCAAPRPGWAHSDRWGFGDLSLDGKRHAPPAWSGGCHAVSWTIWGPEWLLPWIWMEAQVPIRDLKAPPDDSSGEAGPRTRGR